MFERPAVGNNIWTLGVCIFESFRGAAAFDAIDIYLLFRVAPRLGGGTTILLISAFLPEV